MAKVLASHRLKQLDGVKEIRFGDASIEARANNDFSKTGKASGPQDLSSFADVKARAERFGIDVDSSEQVGLGLF